MPYWNQRTIDWSVSTSLWMCLRFVMEFGSTTTTLMLTDYFRRMKIAGYPSDYHHNQSVKGVEIDWWWITMYRILCFITPGTRPLLYQYLFQIKPYLSFISSQYSYSEQGNYINMNLGSTMITFCWRIVSLGWEYRAFHQITTTIKLSREMEIDRFRFQRRVSCILSQILT